MLVGSFSFPHLGLKVKGKRQEPEGASLGD